MMKDKDDQHWLDTTEIIARFIATKQESS